MSEDVRFTPRQRKFIEWLASPNYERYPPTHEELASELGITSRTLRRWKQIPELQETVRQLIRDNLRDDLSDIYGALRKEAKSGSFQHIKLAMEMTGEYTERKEITGAGGGPVTLKVVYDDRNDGTPEETA